jgi:hypothetical protein
LNGSEHRQQIALIVDAPSPADSLRVPVYLGEPQRGHDASVTNT